MSENTKISIDNMNLHYGSFHALKGINMEIPEKEITAFIGPSGCGKSTLASILMGRNKGYTGSVSVGGVPLSSIQEESLLRNITYISHQSYLFKGTVRELSLIHI